MKDNKPAARVACFTHRVRVYWEDTDAGGIVYYANYLKFFERARTEWLRGLGVAQQSLRDSDGLIFIVGATQVNYLEPARLDDLLDIDVQPQVIGRASMLLGQSARRGADMLAESSIRIACVDAGTLRPRRIPNPILERLA
jgi:acyl-CoA thioester hydrolase